MEKSRIGKSYRLGILGGGQLGRMFIQEAINFDVHVHIMENDIHAPSSAIANSFTKGDITDYNDVFNFGKDKDTLTVEIENVNIQALYDLEKAGVNIYPQPHILEMIKDKGIQKQFYIDNDIPTSPFALIDESTSKSELVNAIPFVHKMRTGGYDGKGVAIIRKEEDLDESFSGLSLREDLVPFQKELSVIVSRNAKGETAVYPTVECEFNDANLVEFLFSPANITPEIELKAENLAIEVINKVGLVGILAVELFLTQDNELLVNEIAPRPHNSGHHTIECNITSQFEQHMRSVLNFPLGATDIIRNGAMINLIGEKGYTGPAFYKGLEDIISEKGVHVHIYGKEETKPNRKMGHITIASSSIENAKQLAKKIKDKIRVIS